MPELPEVETIKNGLQQKILHKKIIDIDVLSPKSFLGNPDKILDLPVREVKRRAKTLLIVFGHNLNLLIHLKMTGQLIFIQDELRLAGGHPSHDWHAKLPNQHTRVVFTFEDDSKLFFNDLRKFGWCKLLSDDEVKEAFSLYGPEPFDSRFDLDYLAKMAKRYPERKIKQFIMDQTIIAGIGNIYADESLYSSRIHPLTKVKYLTADDWQKFIANIKAILELSIAQGGTTDSDYVDVDGRIGGMQNFLQVYHKTNQKCPANCGGNIERIVIGGRGTNYCPNCQKVKND